MGCDHPNGLCGQTDSRGGGCGMFHALLPGPDRFCAACRPCLDNERAQEATAWWEKVNERKMPPRATKEWGEALQAWASRD